MAEVGRYWYPIEGSVTAPLGFMAAGVHCGIRGNGQEDLALIFSERVATAAGVFTQNRIKAAPVQLTRKHLARGEAQTIIANSGNANACTGRRGEEDARRMAELVAWELGIKPERVLVASTGIIGRFLPMDKVERGIKELVSRLSVDGAADAARAIMTTDTMPKEVAIEVELSSGPVRIGGVAKGAGMIHPRLATMLCFLTTDVSISQNLLMGALREAVDGSFNSITVDGDTSTNDMVVTLANGMAGNYPIRRWGEEFHRFQEGLEYVTGELARMIVRDGEGATKFVTITVQGAQSREEARQAGFAIANSPLVKTALFGGDPNWGRILAAVGNAGIELKEDRLNLFFDGLQVVRGGIATDYDPIEARRILSHREITITVDLGMGDVEARVHTCDLSCDYIRINAEYSS